MIEDTTFLICMGLMAAINIWQFVWSRLQTRRWDRIFLEEQRRWAAHIEELQAKHEQMEERWYEIGRVSGAREIE